MDADWVSETAVATGIPERALAAYAGASIVKAAAMPECGISWNTIAGIGATESDHGRHGGSAAAVDGTVSPPIYGVPLSGGEGIEHIPDSDGGAIDGDAEFDRAVGPFQLIPQTWRNWHTDGSGDGVEDPQNIDDAAMATANYLCRVSTAIDTEAGWRAAVTGFNSPSSYLDTVAGYAVRYAEAAPARNAAAGDASRNPNGRAYADPMITGELKGRVDRVWEAFWSGRNGNPLEDNNACRFSFFFFFFFFLTITYCCSMRSAACWRPRRWSSVGGRRHTVPAETLVPGDLVLLRAGRPDARRPARADRERACRPRNRR